MSIDDFVAHFVGVNVLYLRDHWKTTTIEGNMFAHPTLTYIQIDIPSCFLGKLKCYFTLHQQDKRGILVSFFFCFVFLNTLNWGYDLYQYNLVIEILMLKQFNDLLCLCFAFFFIDK